jgi:molybdate transport system substrate-binding protein
VLLLPFTLAIHADTLTVAVASNFAETFDEIADAFAAETGHSVRVVRGSSGRHFAQIVNGAPFDLFLSADSARPAELIEALQLPATRLHTYAFGRLALWAGGRDLPDDPIAALRAGQYAILAIANPRLAPYGQAALETLASLAIDIQARPARQLVRGENIAQAYQFVFSGNADLGFVALSQVIQSPVTDYWIVPEELHAPIAQQLVILNDSPAVQALVAVLAGAKGRAMIQRDGYGLPDSGMQTTLTQ